MNRFSRESLGVNGEKRNIILTSKLLQKKKVRKRDTAMKGRLKEDVNQCSKSKKKRNLKKIMLQNTGGTIGKMCKSL
jgi:hypothetical protein